MQNTNPLLSIIIPCYNCESTLLETLKSAEDSCGTKRNECELVLVNDGSTDKTDNIIRDYIKRSIIQITYIIQINKGVSAARNAGIKMSKGKYIFFLDSDDLLAKDYLKVVIKTIKNTYADAIYCQRTKTKSLLQEYLNDKVLIQIDPLTTLKEYTYSKEKIGFQCFAYRRRLISESKIFYPTVFPEDIRFGEDVEFLTKYLANCKDAYALKENCYYYRQSNTSVSYKADYGHTDLIRAVERTGHYLQTIDHPYADRFTEYMTNRAIFHAAHKFAQTNSPGLLKKLEDEYPVKNVMRYIQKDKDVDAKSKIAATAYLISPKLFQIVAKK